MRSIAALTIVAMLALGLYYGYFRRTRRSEQVVAPTQTINLTGIRGDLLQIGQAERSFISQHGRCTSLDELISASAVTVSAAGRDGYSYSIDCFGTDFSVVARHGPAGEESAGRYPTVAVDSTLQFREIN